MTTIKIIDKDMYLVMGCWAFPKSVVILGKMLRGKNVEFLKYLSMTPPMKCLRQSPHPLWMDYEIMYQY